VNGVWTRYPCGVACGAGELVEQTSDLSGSQWTTSALYLQGISLVRRNSEWHHFDPLGTAQVITNGSAQVVNNNLYDVFGVLRYEQGSAQTPWRWRYAVRTDEQQLLPLRASCGAISEHRLPNLSITTFGEQVKPPDPSQVIKVLPAMLEAGCGCGQVCVVHGKMHGQSLAQGELRISGMLNIASVLPALWSLWWRPMSVQG